MCTNSSTNTALTSMDTGNIFPYIYTYINYEENSNFRMIFELTAVGNDDAAPSTTRRSGLRQAMYTSVARLG